VHGYLKREELFRRVMEFRQSALEDMVIAE
jgi:hypothetical protein